MCQVKYYIQSVKMSKSQGFKESRSQNNNGFKSLKEPRNMGSKCLLGDIVFSRRKNSLSLSPEEGSSCLNYNQWFND